MNEKEEAKKDLVKLEKLKLCHDEIEGILYNLLEQKNSMQDYCNSVNAKWVKYKKEIYQLEKKLGLLKKRK